MKVSSVNDFPLQRFETYGPLYLKSQPNLWYGKTLSPKILRHDEHSVNRNLQKGIQNAA